ncbi:hypothetical protein LEN26_010161 [Aphanomyces euteiches]|nr:hypothetical protein LEN26_010161 [Aphanomyces euteiches]
MVVDVDASRFALRPLSHHLTAQVMMGMHKSSTHQTTESKHTSTYDVTQDQRAQYVRRLFQEVVKVHTMLRAPFNKTSVLETCKTYEHDLWNGCATPEEYVRLMRAQVQSIAKKGRCMLQQSREFEVAPSSQSSSPANAYERHVPSASPEVSMKQLQQAHIRRALSSSWLKTQRKASRFRWESPMDAQEEAYVHADQRAAESDILQSIRNLYYNQLCSYEEQLRLSLAAEHRDWVAFDLSVVQGLLATLDPHCEAPQYHHNIQTLHSQIEKVLKEKALFDYMWEMERSKLAFSGGTHTPI